MLKIILIFIGGGVGSVLRYLCTLFLSGRGSSSFPWLVSLPNPWATFCVNIVGCLLIGLFGGLAARFGVSEHVRLMLTVGICGGFTTFSTFSNESLSLLRSGNYLTFILYVTLSIVFGIVAVLIGDQIVK